MKKRGVMLVGLCGRSGSGKGYVSALFADAGIPSVDTDAVYREMTAPAEKLSPCMTALVERFGAGILNPDNSLNRPVMRSLVFGDDPDALRDLNAVTHRYILAETERIAAAYHESGSSVVLVDAPVLYESGFDRMCECVVCVTAPEDVILSRIMKRDGIGPEDAKRRLAAQIPAEELEDRADFVIANDCERDELIRRVEKCAERLRDIRRERYDGGEA